MTALFVTNTNDMIADSRVNTGDLNKADGVLTAYEAIVCPMVKRNLDGQR